MTFCMIESSFRLILIHLHGAMWTCTTDIARAHLSCPMADQISDLGVIPGKGNKCPLRSRRPPGAKTPLEDAMEAVLVAAALPSRDLGKIGLLIWNLYLWGKKSLN